MQNHIKLALLSLSVFVPVAVWAYVKPVRVIAPELTGVTCFDELVCVDDLSRKSEAKSLYLNARSFVQSKLGEIENTPRAIFCSTKECSSKFGLYRGMYGNAGAYNVGTLGLVISYRGWQPYYVRHELIHHVQNEKLGSVNAWFFKPNWFKEGMAYSLSEDPRDPLPETLEAYRKKYNDWSSTLNNSQIWDEADRL